MKALYYNGNNFKDFVAEFYEYAESITESDNSLTIKTKTVEIILYVGGGVGMRLVDGKPEWRILNNEPREY